MTKKKDKPEPGKIYSLTGAPGVACIANGNTWEESVVEDYGTYEDYEPNPYDGTYSEM